MLKFGVIEARVGYPAVYLILDGYSGTVHEGKWPSLSSACATEGEIDYCVKIHKEGAGVMRFDRMDANWKNIVASVVAGAPLAKSSDAVTDTVANWHQECRDLALKLMVRVNSNVVIRLPRAHRNDPQRRIADDATRLRETSILAVEFNVPDAASPIKVEADLRTRSFQVFMTLRAPEDRKSARARTNWLLRQLTGNESTDLHIKAIWPGRAAATQETLDAVRVDVDCLGTPNPNLAPTAFEVRLVRDAGSRFAGTKMFIDELETSVFRFYAEVGQRLKNWNPTPPRMVEEEAKTPAVDAAKEPEQDTHPG